MRVLPHLDISLVTTMSCITPLEMLRFPIPMGLGNPYAEVSSSQTTLVRNRDNFRRNRDFLIILGSVFYLLNIVDAHVSAHLDEFSINEDLAISIEPSMQSMATNSTALGASLILRIK